jgi:ferredoxin
MFPNYIVWYDMSKRINAITKKSNNKLIPIINAIKEKTNNKIGKINTMLEDRYNQRMNTVFIQDKNYNINNNCIGCKICKEVCPVNNIEMVNNKPEFQHHCEQCMACIQYCPQKAINYKELAERNNM